MSTQDKNLGRSLYSSERTAQALIYTFYCYFSQHENIHPSSIGMMLRFREISALTALLLRKSHGDVFSLWCCSSVPFNQAGRFGSVCYHGELDGDQVNVGETVVSNGRPRSKYTAVCKRAAKLGSKLVVFKRQTLPDVWFTLTWTVLD